MSEAIEGEVIEHSNGVAMPEATQKSIAKMNKVAAGLAAMKEKYKDAPDCSTDEGYAQAKSERKEIGQVRIDIEKAHKAGKAFYLEGGRAVDRMKNDILETVSTLENARKEAIKAVDDEKARIEQEAAEKEQRRIESIEAGIKGIRDQLQSVTIESIEQSIADLESISVDSYQEFSENASAAIGETMGVLRPRLADLKEQAAEAAKLEAQRAEQERIAAEQKAQQDKLDAQAKAIEDAKAEQERKEAQAEREKELSAQAEKDKQAALEAAEAKRLADIEKAKEEAAQAERDKAAKAEADRIAKEEKAAAEKAEAERLAAMAPDADQLKAWLETIPAMNSKEGKLAADKIASNVTVMIEALSAGKKAA